MVDRGPVLLLNVLDAVLLLLDADPAGTLSRVLLLLPPLPSSLKFTFTPFDLTGLFDQDFDLTQFFFRN